jgi:flagellar biosynthetic protein FlhB
MPEELGERTERPTERKLREARLRGNVARSADFSGAIDLASGLVLLLVLGSTLVTGLSAVMRQILDGRIFGSLVSTDSLPGLASWATWRSVWIGAPFLAIMAAIAILAQLMQTGWHPTVEPLKPDLSRIDPLKGARRLLSRRSAVKAGMSVLKLGIVVLVALVALASQVREIAALPRLTVGASMIAAGRIALEVAAWILVLLLLIGIVDLWFQKWQRLQDLRMSKQEVKDERRSIEGDMETRARRLRLARQMLLQRMRKSVPTADVVVTNPTHFAVAIRYDAGQMHAPKVVAKGADFMAFRIREIAVAAGIPIVEKPALARALYAGVEVGRFVTPEFYQAVAEILAYVYRLKGKAA